VKPRTSRNTKRTKVSEKVSKQDPRQNAPKVEKPQLPPPTLGMMKTEPVAKVVAKKAGARSAAAKKAAATWAANHQVLVDKITAELEAVAQRATDAGGYQPGTVTKTKLKSRMKRYNENIKQEEARERLEAAAGRREQSAEAKQIAAAEKQAAAAKKVSGDCCCKEACN